MATKAADRLAEIRARVARRAEPAEPVPQAQDADAALAAASAHFLGVDQILQGRTVQRIPIGHIAPDMRPEMRQPRLIPLPDELMVQGQQAPAYTKLISDLLSLGESLKEHQIQPIVVYEGTSSHYPAARYLILVGHRRWTAATLVGLDTIDAVVVDAPSPAERVVLQYTENEKRADFSDMERAWALSQMKHALGDVPWETVEEQFHISRTRRQELTRLLAFTPEQQQRIALLRIRETQIRSLHEAVRDKRLDDAQVDALLSRLGQIAAERTAEYEAASDAQAERANGGAPRRPEIDEPTVARLVARAYRTAADAPRSPAPRWLPPLRQQVAHASKGLQRARDRVATLDPASASALLNDLEQLIEQITAVTTALAADALEESRVRT